MSAEEFERSLREWAEESMKPLDPEHERERRLAYFRGHIRRLARVEGWTVEELAYALTSLKVEEDGECLKATWQQPALGVVRGSG